ncbi:uncharacterized protein LOC144048471 [Vanacampus margaritifer]
MAAQVEVQSGEVGRTMTRGRPHLSPLTDSSNTSPSITPLHIITPEPQKPAPGPKPRLTPKPFAVDKKNTIKPILAPKPQIKPRPESTNTTGYKPEAPNSPEPQQPVAIVKPRPVSTSSSRPVSTSFRTSTKLNTGQTIKPVVHPFKPAPPFDLVDTNKKTPPLPAERQKPKMTPVQGGASIARAKSLGFLHQIDKEDEQNKSVTVVPPRPQPRSSRPRPVSAVFLNNPEIPVPAPRLAGGKPLSPDLTSKFESIGLSLHRKAAKANVKESTPKEKELPQKTQQEKISTSGQNSGIDKQSDSDEQSNDISDKKGVKDTNEDQRGTSIKSRINLLRDSSSAPPETVSSGQTSALLSPEQTVPESEPQVGVKQLIKQLTEDITSTQSPVMKPALKHRNLSSELTKKFSSERLSDSDNVSLSAAAENQEISKDPQEMIDVINPSGKMAVEFQHHLKKISSVTESPEAEHVPSATSNQSGPSVEGQTMQASIFDNIVERSSVTNGTDLLSNPSWRGGNNEDEGSLVTVIYKDSVSPSPLRVNHAMETVQAMSESRVVSESMPSAQREDKAMTLRSRRSEGNRPLMETTGLIKGEPPSTMPMEKQPRYLRIGSLQKWPTTGVAQDGDAENATLKQSQRGKEMDLSKDKDRQREADHEEIAAAPKRMKTLQIDEKPKPKATYFALTGQIQESDTGSDIIDSAAYDDIDSGQVSSQGKVDAIKRNLSFKATLGKTQEKYENVRRTSHISARHVVSALNGPTSDKMTEVVKTGQTIEDERQNGKMKIIDWDKQRQMEIERQAIFQFSQMKERELQREFERRKAFEREKQKLSEIQNHNLQGLEFENMKEIEKLRQLHFKQEKANQQEQEMQRRQEVERQRDLEKQRQQEMHRQREQEQERQHKLQRQREQELERQQALMRQREQEMERQLEQMRMREQEKEREREVERLQQLMRLKEQEKEQQKELDRQREMERQQELMRLIGQEEERQREVERQQELMRLKEQEMERRQELERQQEQLRQREREMDRQREVERQQTQMKLREQEMERQQQLERQKEHEKERRRELERQQEQLRLREQEMDRLRDCERQQEQLRLREQELERRRELKRQQERLRQREQEMERQQELEHQEQKRQREEKMERLRELERQQREQEMERQQELEHQEQKRQREEKMERLRELERQQREQDMERQRELQQQQEKLRLKEQEMERRRELKRQQERLRQREQEMERRQELEQQQEQVRLMEQELERQRELKRQQQQLRQREQEMERQRGLAQQQEKVRLKEQQMERQQEFKRQQEQLKQREQERERLQELESQQEQMRLLEEENERQRGFQKQQELDQERQLEWERQRQREEERQTELDKEALILEMQRNKRMEELGRVKEKVEGKLLDQKQKQKENERYHPHELEKQRYRENAEKAKLMASEQEMLRLKGVDKERGKQRQLEKDYEEELEREKFKELDRLRDLQRQKQLHAERQNQKLIQQPSQSERLRWEAEREKMQKAEAEKIRQIARLQEAERHRLKDKQRKEEQERMRVDQLRPKVVDVDSLLRTATTEHIDPALRWKEPSPRVDEPYKPSILDVDSFTSQSQPSSNQTILPVSSIQEVDSNFGSILRPGPERDITWKIPPQTSVDLATPVWTISSRDPRELQPTEMSHNKPLHEPRKHTTKVSLEQLLYRHDEHSLASQSHWRHREGEPLSLDPFAQKEATISSAPVDQVWLPRQLKSQDKQEDIWNRRRSQGSQELNRMRSRSMSRRSAPSGATLEKSLSRIRSRSAHREQDHQSWEQQKQGEDERKDSETPVGETDSQYGTWETGLRMDDSLTPATPSSESNLSPSPRNTTPSHVQGEHDSFDGLHPPSKSENEPLLFPDAPTPLLDSGVLRSRVQLGKKRAPRTRPSRAARQNTAQDGGGGATSDDWLYRDSTEEKVERKMNEVDSEKQARGADAAATVASQPQRVALFPGVDSQALKVQLKKRSDSDNQSDAASPSLPSRSPKSPFLPRAARVLPPAGGKENGEEESPQWLKELKSKKRLSQYENES